MAEPVDGNGDRLGPTEDDVPGDDGQDHGQDDRPEGVDVPERVEGEPAGALGRVVAEPERYDAVTHLVEDDGWDEAGEEDQRPLG